MKIEIGKIVIDAETFDNVNSYDALIEKLENLNDGKEGPKYLADLSNYTITITKGTDGNEFVYSFKVEFTD